ncbi:MAG TPA: ABC transporter ATP-binding protein [Clostridia bacterium]|nr:ABC transporter ATP-binding protein [Clostridia bacterium]
MRPYLQVQELAFSYGEQQILEEISFQVQQGGFVAIIGPNGSGKSTLLKNISASLTPREGAVLLSGEEIFKISPKELARKLAVVPQDTQVQFPFTVMETVLMGRMPHQKRFQGDSPQDLAVARWALELTSTWDLRERLITEVSGGERQRVIVARALAQEPQVLLLDEPTAHLDLQYQMELLELLQSLNETSQITILAVLHDLNLAAQFSKYVILLHKRGIFAAGTPEQVLTAANLREVYGMEVIIAPNDLTGRFNIIPVGRSSPETGKTGMRVHLICGGGTGSFIMDRLVQNGYQVSCGVLNIGDSDWSKAKSLGLELVEEAPFTGIRPEIYKKNQRLIQSADVVVVMPIPFGTGNLGNLLQAREAALEGKSLILVGDDQVEKRDFTGGKATRVYRELLAGTAYGVFQPVEIFLLLTRLGEEAFT